MDERLVVFEDGVNQLLQVSEQGPPGPAGLPGAAGASVVQALAAVALSGHLAVVYNNDGQLIAASADVLNHSLRVAGITTGAAVAGALMTVQQYEVMDHAGWAWLPDAPVFLGLAGALVQQPVVGGFFLLVVGQALTPTRILINLQPALILS